MTGAYNIPLVAKHTTVRNQVKRVLTISASDIEDAPFPPAAVNEKHREIVEAVDRRKLPNGERVGWIKTDGADVLDWHIDEQYLREGETL